MAASEPEADVQHTTESAATTQDVYREVREFVRSHESRRRQLPRALLVGLVAGGVGVLFRWGLAAGEAFRDRLYTYGHAHPTWGLLLPIAFSALGAWAAVSAVRRWAPEASGSGIPHMKAVLYHLRSLRWQRLLPVKFVGGLVGISGGLALGREGPTIQMGGAVGQMISQWLRTTSRERQTLIAAGAGAGVAAAFNAPLAGVVFVLEELQRDFTPTVFTASFIAAVIADVVTRLLTGQLPVLHVTIYPAPPLGALPAFLILGILTGLLGVIYNRTLLESLKLFHTIRSWPWELPAALVGAVVGLVGWFEPGLLGSGRPLVEGTLAGIVALNAIPLLFLLRFFLHMLSYGCGAPGGIFAPLLGLGALVGLAVGIVTQGYFPREVSLPQMFAVVGMAAYFTAIVRAPLTGIVLIIEMTGNYNLMLPLLVACITAYGLADLLGDRPVYEALLERDLLRGQENPELEETLLLEMPVQPGAPFEGKRVRDLGLPPGCILVTVHHGYREEVPTADTKLAAGDRITAVVAPQAAHAIALLREGTESE